MKAVNRRPLAIAFVVVATILTGILFQNFTTPQANRTLKNSQLPCQQGYLCDGKFKGNSLVQHPNVDYLLGRFPRGFDITTLTSLLSINSDDPNTLSPWKVENHWSSYPLIKNSYAVNDSRFLSSKYQKTRALQLTPNILEQDARLFDIGIKRALELSPLRWGTLRDDLKELKTFTTPSTVMIFNPNSRSPNTFGHLTFSYSTYKEQFGETPSSTIFQIINDRGLSFERKKQLVQRYLIRNEEGLDAQIAGGGPCAVIEHSLNPSEQSQYCKWLNFGMGQNFQNPLKLKNGIELSTTIRLLHYNDLGVINDYLPSQSSLHHPAHRYSHLNYRITLQKKRARPISFFDRRSGKNIRKDFDRISVHIPIFSPEEHCIAFPSQPICADLEQRIDMNTSVINRPDIGTGMFMLKIGRVHLKLGVEGGGTTVVDKIIKFHEGKWLNLSMNSLPGFSSHMRKATAACQANYRTWNIPQAWCDIESFNWQDYEITNFTFGSEVRGLSEFAFQIDYITLK